jgi:hypothetical protein
MLFLAYFLILPVPMAAWSKVGTVFNRTNTGIVASNPTRGMDMCPRFSVLCFPVYVVASRRADPPSKESYQMSKNRFMKVKVKLSFCFS